MWTIIEMDLILGVLENTENINGRKLGQSQQGGTGMMFPVNEGSPGEVGSSDGRLPGEK